VSEVVRPEISALLRRIFAEQICFNRFLGLEIVTVERAPVAVAVDMRGDLVGNFTRGVLHGGVISTCLDVAGGLAAFREVAVRMEAAPVDEVAARFGRIGTIDLRVDYLRPGLGRRFTATAHIMRHGNKVAVARMELHNERAQLIAAGTGAYVVA